MIVSESSHLQVNHLEPRPVRVGGCGPARQAIHGAVRRFMSIHLPRNMTHPPGSSVRDLLKPPGLRSLIQHRPGFLVGSLAFGLQVIWTRNEEAGNPSDHYMRNHGPLFGLSFGRHHW